jgi:hypothetical protein
MPTTPGLTDINNYFKGRVNQIERRIYHRTWRTNPFISLFKREPYTMEDGREPTVITSTHELPTAYPFGLPNQALSTGTGNPATVDATIIKSGHKTRTFQLEVAAFETEAIDLHTVQNMFQGVQQVKNKERGLADFSTVWMSDWYRVHNIGMINTKLSTNSATGFAQKSDALYNFSTLALPTHYFNWVHAALLYDQMVRIGAGEYAVGSAMGSPVFAMVCGPGYKRELLQNDEQTRETINYSADAKLNLLPRGINQAVNGFAPNIDEFPIRYAADGTTAIYPTTNGDTTVGRESKPNPNYRTVAQGGLAVYEVITILCRDIYTVKPRPVGPTQFGDAKFNAIEYSGTPRWINNPDMGTNKLGNLGFYRMDMQMAAKPEYPELGISILTLARD